MPESRAHGRHNIGNLARACTETSAIASRLLTKPTSACALFFGQFANDLHCAASLKIAHRRQDRVCQGHRSSVRGSERQGIDGGKEKFVAVSRQRRNISVRNADAVGAANASLFSGLHRGSQTATKRNGDHQILLGQRSHGVVDRTMRGSNKDRKPQQTQLVAKIFGHHRGKVACDDGDSAGGIDASSKLSKSLGIKRIFQALKILKVAKHGISGRLSGASALFALLHRIERSSECQR